MQSQSNLAALTAARRDPAARPAQLPEPPRDAAAAYYLQHSVMAGLGPIGGWKVGSPSPTGPFTCAPLPTSRIMPSPARVEQDACPDRGVEAEIAVRMAADLPPRDLEYSRDEVMRAIGSAHPAIELLQSRFSDVDAVDPLSALADSLSHHGLVWGEAIPDWQAIDLGTEGVRVLVNGVEIKRATGNPAGDMLRLVVWMANEGARWAGGLRAGQFVTTGSWTGKDFVPPGATVRMAFDQCGSVEVQYRMTQALIVGTGPGLSASFARALAKAGHTVALAARRTDKLTALAAETGASLHACDATDAAAVAALFDALPAPGIVLYNASYRVRGPFVELDPAEVAKTLAVSAFAGFLVAQQAAKRMLVAGQGGTILLTGASAGVKGYAHSAPFAMGKFALRGLAQSMARELHPQGVHVVHVVVDGGIRAAARPEPADKPDSMLDPDAIAATMLHMLEQPRSAWTDEIAVRPWVERF